MFFLDFYIDPGGPGDHPGVPRTHPGGEKHKKLQISKIPFFFEFRPAEFSIPQFFISRGHFFFLQCEIIFAEIKITTVALLGGGLRSIFALTQNF